MNQREAPEGTVATLGHPANGVLIVKTDQDFWRYVRNGRRVDDEDFRAGWDTPKVWLAWIEAPYESSSLLAIATSHELAERACQEHYKNYASDEDDTIAWQTRYYDDEGTPVPRWVARTWTSGASRHDVEHTDHYLIHEEEVRRQ